MQFPVFTITGEKKGSRNIPESLLVEHANKGLAHQALVMQQNNRRQSPAHVKTRGEVRGSTKKPYPQKHTGNARRGPLRSPLLRGGGKAFGPRNERNFVKRMPKEMRHAALRSCLTLQANAGIFLGLESFPDTIKTKQMHAFLQKVTDQLGRRILIILPTKHRALELSARNIAGVTSVHAAYLNPEDVLVSRRIVVVGDALEKAAEIFGIKEKKGIKGTDDRSEIEESNATMLLTKKNSSSHS
jgi:large subunit ribosomal protein L4